jgi:hypothetical protein
MVWCLKLHLVLFWTMLLVMSHVWLLVQGSFGATLDSTSSILLTYRLLHGITVS